MSDPPQVIHHLAPASELRGGCTADTYAPPRLSEDGFVHCCEGEDATLAVAGDYFADLREPLFVLVVDPTRVRAVVRWEAPAPLPDGGREHLARADAFPHVYGPLDRDAIRGVGRLGQHDGRYTWPERFEALEDVLDRT